MIGKFNCMAVGCAVVLLISSAACAGDISLQMYWDNNIRGEVFNIYSTVPQWLNCYVPWTGIQTGVGGSGWCSDGVCGQGGGQTVSGRIQMTLPPYRGGAPIVGSSYITGVGNVSNSGAQCTPER
jgi:hypothetical protein